MTASTPEPAEISRVADHLSDEVRGAIDTGEVECLIASRRLEDGTAQIVHAHNEGAIECPLWGVLIADPRIEAAPATT